MNKLFVATLAVLVLLGSCSKDDDKPTSETGEKLVTPEMAAMAVSSGTSFTGTLMVLPCLEDTSIYYGNYNKEGAVNSVHAYYAVVDGSIANSVLPVRLPVGSYNFLYWGNPRNGLTDSTYANAAVQDPGLRVGINLADLSYELRRNYPDTTYYPVYDYVYAVSPIQVGTEKMQATLRRVVAGLKVILTNRGGATMNPSIASARILVGGIANNLNYYTAEPSSFSKTVAFPLSMSTDSLSMSANSTVMVFPSGENPLLTILLVLKDGRVKKFSKPLANSLVAGNRLNLNITLGDLFVEEGTSDGFEVENWTESNETIDFPAG